MKKLALYLVAAAVMSGCGSDDSRPGVMPGLPSGGTGQPNTPNQPPTDSTPPPPFPDGTQTEARLLAGIYTGTSTDVTGRSYIIDGLVDDKKQFWFIHSRNDEILGFTNSSDSVKGTNGEFSVKGVEYSYDDRRAINLTLEGNYKTAKVISGKTFDVPSNPTTYTVKYDETLSAKKQTLSLVNNKGFRGEAYLTGDENKEIANISFINTSGDFVGNIEGCTMTGKLTPAGSGLYFNASVKFTSTLCLANGETYTGVALIDNSDELIVIGTNGSKSRGIFFSSDTN